VNTCETSSGFFTHPLAQTNFLQLMQLIKKLCWFGNASLSLSPLIMHQIAHHSSLASANCLAEFKFLPYLFD